MDIETVKEMWELTEGGEMPKDFLGMVNVFVRRKSAFRSADFTESDFATCVTIYRTYSALGKKIFKQAKEA